MRGDRLGLLQLARVAIAGAAIAAVASVDTLSDVSPNGQWPAVPALTAWLLISFVAEAARRIARVRNVAAPVAMLMVDGLVLGFLTANTGGYRSALLGLVYFHVAAVSLLVSHRMALRIAVWHGFLLFAGFVAAASHSLGLVLRDDVTSAGQQAALHASGFLLVAVGVAACSALNEHVTRRTHRELSAIAEVGAALGGTLEVDGLLVAAADALRVTLGVERVAIAMTDRDAFRAVTSAPEVTTVLAGPPGPMVAAIRDVVAPLQLRSLASLPLEVVAPEAGNVVVVPLRVGVDHGVLLLVFGGDAHRRVPLTTVTAAGHVATLVGTMLENARLHARVEHLATRDGLTGLVNRRVFDEELAADVRRAHRTGEPFSLVVLDVDHFKLVNDVHGHQAGDEVLRRVAAALAAATRETDLAARYGGEEFVVLLRGCAAADALEAADKLRAATVLRDGPVPVTVSAGVASFPDQATDGASLVEAADGALYQAKRHGRDQTRLAGRRRLGTPVLGSGFARLSLVERRSA